MTVISLRSIATNCLGLGPDFSVMGDVFGYPHRNDSGFRLAIRPSVRPVLSLRHQLELCRGPAVDLNLIVVGEEAFTAGHLHTIQRMVQYARDLYDDVELGIRRIRWLKLSVAEAGDYLSIDSEPRTVDLTNEFSGPGGALDVFFVLALTYGIDGLSEVDGRCTKYDSDDMPGSVVSLNFRLGVDVLAHEVGHYLGLHHGPGTDNIMGDDDGMTGSEPLGIKSWQGAVMKLHCYVSDKC